MRAEAGGPYPEFDCAWSRNRPVRVKKMKHVLVLIAVLIAGCASSGQGTMTREDVEELRVAFEEMAEAMDHLLEVQAED